MIGLVTLLPYFKNATDGYNEVADAKMAFAKALNDTNNCGLSGSNETLLNVAKGHDAVAQAVSSLAEAIRNNTNDAGQLKLLTGDIRQIADQIENVGVALKTLASFINTLTDNIDTVSLDGVDKLVASQKNSTNASRAFYAAFIQLKAPSKTLLQVTSLLFGFTDALSNMVDGLQAEIYAISAAEGRCNVSTGIPKALNSYKESVDAIDQQVMLLQ